MEVSLKPEEIENKIAELSSEFDYSIKETAIILAAGHGKRIKSKTSKMLHRIWEIPTVERVCNACKRGLKDVNTIVVVGIKASDVMSAISADSITFAYQAEQNGTGHAVQVALDKIEEEKYDGIVYVFPGDMGLIDAATIKMFRDEFIKSGNDMMVLTGLYEGPAKENSYGRIVRVKEFDKDGNSSNRDLGKVVGIIEHKDILKLGENGNLTLSLNGKSYSYSQDDLINNNEFNSSVYAFKFKHLAELINKIENNNAQKEIYLTDLITLFNNNGLSVGAVSPKDQHVIMGFNNKSVLRQMDNVARNEVYEQLKDIVEIDDPEDFFIDEGVVADIIEMDSKGETLDIRLGKGVYIGKGVKLNANITLRKNVFVLGEVVFGKNVSVSENVHLSCYTGQKLFIGNNVSILWGNIIKGNIVIGDGSIIESSVNMTGSDDYPLSIGKNVTVKGTSYIFGSVIDDDLLIEHSVLIRKKIEKLVRKNGTVLPVRFYLPMPEGIDAIEDLN